MLDKSVTTKVPSTLTNPLIDYPLLELDSITLVSHTVTLSSKATDKKEYYTWQSG